VLADHGLVDVPPAQCIDLAAVPGLADCLATAPAGDQRQMSLFVRPRKQEAFERVFETYLAHACRAVGGDELLAAGVYGPGTHHPALFGRVGDVVLLSHEGWGMIHTPPGVAPLVMPGSHGGMSAAEVRIPLYCVHCP
jgi:hypothetical protein